MYCKYWASKSCRHGYNCRFIHSGPISSNDTITHRYLDEPHVNSSSTNSISSNQNIPCRNWDGTPESCKYGVNCRYLHPISATEKYTPYLPCKYWTGEDGSCPYGRKCSYLHADINSRPLVECCVCSTAPILDDKRNKYGLFEGCDHVICISCALSWRRNLQVSKEARLGCPICRTLSPIITPCYEALQGDERLAKIAQYKEFRRTSTRRTSTSRTRRTNRLFNIIDSDSSDDNSDISDEELVISVRHTLTNTITDLLRTFSRRVLHRRPTHRRY